MTVGEVTPAWVGTVPAIFRSTAQSIENHRIRLVGDPGALRAAAAGWDGQAGTADDVWEGMDGVRGRVGDAWEGAAATAFQGRAEQFQGEVSATATSLRFAADGLGLAAGALERTRAAADAVVLRYAAELRRMSAVAGAAPTAAQPQAMAAMIQRGLALSAQALQAVYAQETALDHVLASMPNRFVVGPAAPWRAGMPVPQDTRGTDTTGAAVTIAGVRTTRREGMTITELADGRVQIAFNDSYAMGLHVKAGSKLKISDLPAGVREALGRVYGEAETAPVLTYQQRYTFADRAEADAFLDRLDGPGAVVRSVAGFVTGPIGDFGPWHTELLGRRPDETVVQLGVMAKANADAGVWPLAGVSGTGSFDANVTMTVAADGSSSLSTQGVAQGRAGGTLAGLTGTVGGGELVTTRVDYDASGTPVQYTHQEAHDRDPHYVAGTANTYVGVTPGGGATPDGVYVKADAEAVHRTIETRQLDLRDPDNLAAYQAAQGPGRIEPLPPPVGAFGERLDGHGLAVTEHAVVERTAIEGSVGIEQGPLNVSLKGGPSTEDVLLLDGRYVDPARPDTPRPVPRDPR